MQLTPCQAKALHLLNSRNNVFLTGAAGTGKSFLLQQFLRGKDWNTHPILASTGTAAMIVGGRTFHSFFGLGIMEGGRDATVARGMRNKRLHRRIQEAQCVIVDEVSMLSGETLSTAEHIARCVRENEQPWGGLRIVAVGDFAQLPPVQDAGKPKDWGFQHPIWHASQFSPAYLSTPVRSQDKTLLSVLNSIRDGQVTDSVVEFLQNRTMQPHTTFTGTRLFPHRATADRYNDEKLGTLQGRVCVYPTYYEGSSVHVEHLKRQCPISEALHVKVGALVMFRKNATSYPYEYVNGTLGTIVALSDDVITVRSQDGTSIDVVRATFSFIDGNGIEKASAYNFPLTLAWATTIHKAQGASIDSLLVNLTRLWESGHAYVALSRARSESGLFVEQWDARSIIADPAVQDFYHAIRSEWERIATTLPDSSPTLSTEARSKPKKKEKKMKNHRKTLPLVQQKKSLEEIATILAWKEDTIVRHIEKLLLEREPLDIEYLRPPEEQFDRIAAAFYEHGMEALKPIYDACEGDYTYTDVRLVKLFVEKDEGARF
jgi:ATP-dependent DNA helicase PIF1